MMATLQRFLGGIMSASGGVVASLCCVLPLAVVLLGLGSGAFMATTMKYTPIFVPFGVMSVSAGFYLYFSEQRRCAREGCRMVGRAWNLAVLGVSALLVAAAVFFSFAPRLASDLLMWATADQSTPAPPPMDMPIGPTR